MAARCPYSAPSVIAVAPLLEDGTPFPTTFWLTCPVAVEAVHAAESRGEHVAWARRAQEEADLAAALLTSDAAYRAARAAEGGGADPCADVGVAGQRDALHVKCLHARLAAHWAGVADPAGAAVAAEVSPALQRCDGARCDTGGS